MTLRRFGSQQVPPYPRQLQVFGRKKQVVRSDVCQKAPMRQQRSPAMQFATAGLSDGDRCTGGCGRLQSVRGGHNR